MFEEEEKEEELSKGKNLVKKRRDKELENLLHLCKDLEDEEKKAEIDKVTL